MNLFTPCDVAPWRDEALGEIDEAILREGGIPLSLDWEKFSLRKDDGLHFTHKGLTTFLKALLDALLVAIPPSPSSPRIPLYILTDSTLAHHGKERLRKMKRWLSARLGRPVKLDAVCGTGFVAGAKEDMHFWARLRKRRRRGGWGHERCHFLVMGGWNDVNDRRKKHAPSAAARLFSHL